MKSSFHILIPFLTLLSDQFNSSAPNLICRQAGVSKLDFLNWNLLYNHFARTKQKTQTLYCWKGLFTTELHSSGSYSIVACVFVAAGICLPSRCLAINVYFDFVLRLSGIMSQYLPGLFVTFNKCYESRSGTILSPVLLCMLFLDFLMCWRTRNWVVFPLERVVYFTWGR
jgi:hypothetical protein